MYRLRKLLFVVVAIGGFLATLGYPVYAAIFGGWPLPLMAEWQFAVYGRDSRLADAVILGAVLLALTLTWMTLMGRVLTPEDVAKARAARDARPGPRSESEFPRNPLFRGIAAHPLVFLVVALALVAGGVAGGYWMAAKSGETIAAEEIDLETGKRPTADYVRVTGIARTDLAISLKIERRSGTTLRTYIPIIPQGQRNRPVVYFLRLEEEDYWFFSTRPRATFSLEGKPSLVTLSAATTDAALPGRMRDAFEEAKVPLAANPVILDLDLHSTAGFGQQAAWVATFAGIFVFFLALLFAANRRTKR